jgi:hypothetical protein
MSRDMENEAKVFGEGDVTIVVNMMAATARVYVGTQVIGLIQKLRLDLDVNEPLSKIEFTFPQSHDKDSALRIEEQVRSVRQHVPWARISR